MRTGRKSAVPRSAGPVPNSFMGKLRSRKIIETVAAFAGGGLALVEFVHHIIVNHYHFPSYMVDLTIAGLTAAMIVTVLWRWFRGTKGGDDVEPLPKAAEGLELNPDKKSIVVLPFRNISADPDQEYFCDGLAEELINSLTHVSGLFVVARTSAFSFKGRDIDIREIGRTLNVGAVLEGSVRKAGDRLRITAQLIDVRSGFHIWSQSYDRTMSDLFTIQDDMALSITNGMKVKLLGEESARIVKRPSDNLETYNLYLRGLALRRRLNPEDLRKSIGFFNRAIEIDPEFAPAYAGMAYAKCVAAYYSPDAPRDLIPEARQAATKALQLDDNLAEAHEAQALVHISFDWDWRAAEKECRKILELNPGYAWGYFQLSNVLNVQSRLEEALSAVRRAHALDPLNAAFNRNLGDMYLRMGQLDEAAGCLRRTIEMEPDFVYSHTLLGYVYLQESAYEDALREIGSDRSLSPSLIEINTGIVYARMGRFDEARRVLSNSLDRKKKEHVSPYHLALLYFALDDHEKGFKWLREALAVRDPWLTYIKGDFLLEHVRKDPRFRKILEKMNLL